MNLNRRVPNGLPGGVRGRKFYYFLLLDCLVTVVYLGWSLWTKQWDITYMIWPVAAVLYAALYGIVRMVMKLDRVD